MSKNNDVTFATCHFIKLLLIINKRKTAEFKSENYLGKPNICGKVYLGRVFFKIQPDLNLLGWLGFYRNEPVRLHGSNPTQFINDWQLKKRKKRKVNAEIEQMSENRN